MSSLQVKSPRAPQDDDPNVRELITPEGVDLRLVLGDAGQRIGAFFLDLAIIIGMLVGATLVAVVLALATGFVPGEFLLAVWLLISFFLRNFYFMFFELSPRAATPGKRLLGLRVASRAGGPLTAEAIFARNAMRELELFLPLSFLAVSGPRSDVWVNIAALIWCGVFVLLPLFNRDRLRVGDLVGGTWIVRAPKRVIDTDVAGTGIANSLFSSAALGVYGIKELNVLEDVLRHRDPTVVSAVAARIRDKIGATAREGDIEFLQGYYTALRMHLESGLLFGRRRRDKFDIP